ncbi:tetratricopeptide repeat protein [Paludisphaera rhizosphaerae]|uniref:tetratricopeptide repeat protein n=1 Tax=Paludisphaera rhizosphaerae TaxID=2711216 RepID=UPI0013EDB35C|nr:tetratricopeptide repeat protein [Paludisphaera rhizosphaerae]
MTSTTTSEKAKPAATPPEALSRLRELYEAGDYLGAFQIAKRLGPMTRWPGAAAKVLAGRLAWQLGAVRLGLALPLRAWRDDPHDPEARYYRARTMLGRRGPLATLRFLDRTGGFDDASDEIRADWEATYAAALGGLRDFERAERRLEAAERMTPGRAWLLVERSSLLEMEDRYEEALAAAKEALAVQPWYRPAVQAYGHLLQLLDREADAIEFLTEADRRMCSGVIASQLAALQVEAGLNADAMATLDRYVELSPMMDSMTARWLAARRSDAAYRLGDVAGAVKYAREAGEGFFKEVADRMEAAEADARRVKLAVPFVRQHHETCAPATLSALARFWGRPADHLEVAEAICYDGTPDHRERSWAANHGWIAREFTVTWDAAVALLDRGVPFTLTTVEPGSAHLQAAIGYDARRGTLLIRDPSLPHEGEALAAPFFERYRSVGPRGMTLAPADRPELLADLRLPDEELYDRLHRIKVALARHDREAAASELQALTSEAPDHRLTLQARRVVAIYDADTSANLGALVSLRSQFPNDVNLRLFQLSCLREFGRRDDRLALYQEACAAPKADPILHRQYAEELLADAREQEHAERLARLALRARPTDAAAVSILARIAWNAGRREEAVELHRLAACLSDKDEWLARTYFSAARMLRREEEALQFMRDRVRRHSAKSSQPARTLHTALMSLDRATEAQEVLDSALRVRPHDGELLLFAAEANATIGRFDHASDLLEQARTWCRRGDWLRAAATLASGRGDLAGALTLWREVLESEPSAVDAVRSAASLLDDTEGRAAALDQLRAACERSPHNYSMHQTMVEFLRGEGPEVVEPALRRLLDVHPASAWGRRELAMLLSRAGGHDEAFAEMARATALEPESTFEAGIRGYLLENAGRLAEAREAYREAVRRDVDNEHPITRLVSTSETQSERREVLAFVAEELKRQVIYGDGLLAFARHARWTLGSDGLLEVLIKAWEARPDLWHAWSAVIDEHVSRSELEEAESLARRAADRFPLLPRVQLDLATVLRARNDVEGERAALNRALAINPGWGRAACSLAQSLEASGLYEESRAVLERAVRSSPMDPIVNGHLADALWHLGEKESARSRLEVALRLDPAYSWAWRSYAEWSNECGESDAALKLAREIVAARPGDARAWKALEAELTDADDLDERLKALEQAAAISPRDLEIHDRKAEILADAGRFDEAEAACAPAVFGDRTPLILRGRAAWVAAKSGDRALARTLMRSLLHEDPDYAWGWRRLTEWARDDEDNNAYLEAAENSARLYPDDPWVFGLLGQARLASGDRAGAKQAYTRAVDLAPEYDYALMELFDLQLESRELDEAGATLARLQRPDQDALAFVLAREIQLLAVRKEKGAALDALRRLLIAPDVESTWPWTSADETIVAAGWARAADAVYESALAQPDAAPRAGETWARRGGLLRALRVGRALRRIVPNGGEATIRALTAHIRHLGNLRQAVPLRLCLRRHGATIRDNLEAWAMTGYALRRTGRPRAVVKWISDWRDREGVTPWMLISLALSQRSIGNEAEANAIARAALELPEDGRSPWHSVWLALDAAVRGDLDATVKFAQPKITADFDGLHAYVQGLAQLLTNVERAEPSDRSRAATRAGKALKQLAQKHRVDPIDHKLALRAWRRTIRRLSSHVPAWRRPIARLWFETSPPRIG